MTDRKVLFVSRLNPGQTNYFSGGDVSSKVFLDYYLNEYGSQLDIFSVGFLRIRIRLLNRLVVLLNVLSGRFNGLTYFKVKRFEQLLNSVDYECIIFDSSLYGELVKYSKKKKIRTIVIYQNLEVDYFTGQFLLNKWYDFLLLKKAYFSERQSIEYADKNYFLTNYDAQRAKRFYSVKGEVETTKVLLNSLFRKENFNLELNQNNGSCYYFLGSNNSQNRNALKFILQNSEIRPLNIFGSVCNYYSPKSNDFQNVYFKGEVADLNSAVKGDTLVAPLFGGSGIKIKIIEAIANGNQVITSVEGLSGLEFALDSNAIVLHDFSGKIREIPKPNWSKFYNDLDNYLNI